MNGMMLIGAIFAALGIAALASGGSAPAAACNRTDGCVLEVLRESQKMKQDGRMSQGMREGRENIEAFQRFQAANQPHSTKKLSAGRR